MPNKTTFKSLPAFQKDINNAMEAYFKDNAPPKIAPHGPQAYEFLREFSLRPGKRIRGTLALVAYEMFGGKDHQAGLNLAVAIELIQNYLLIVDDVIDRSETRRGGPTVHEEYLKLLSKNFTKPEARHLSNMLGVGTGIIAQHLASELLASIDASPDKLQEVQRLFHQNILATCYGQIEDVFNNTTQDVSEDNTLQTYILKNSFYTFINPLQCGAALAGASDKQLAVIYNFGVHAGVAFQLQDDIIGMFGDESQTGKSAMDDLREGKRTVLIHHALTHGNPKQIATIQRALGNNKLTELQHKHVVTILDEIGSRNYVSEKANKEIEKSLQIISSFQDLSGHDFLHGLLTYIIERQN